MQDLPTCSRIPRSGTPNILSTHIHTHIHTHTHTHTHARMHTQEVKSLPDDQLDKVLFLVYDMDNIMLQMRTEKEDQDLRKTYGFLFQFLKKNMLQPKLPSLAKEKLGVPPFEKPSIAKVYNVRIKHNSISLVISITFFSVLPLTHLPLFPHALSQSITFLIPPLYHSLHSHTSLTLTRQ